MDWRIRLCIRLITLFFFVFIIIPHQTLCVKHSKNRHYYRYGTFHESVICSGSYPPAQPSTLQDLQQIISFAIAHNITVKPVGARHSATDIICTDGLPIYMEKISHFSYEPGSGIATVGGGASLEYLSDQLHSVGRALTSMPIYSGVTIAGAIGTGAHGSSLVAPATLSDQLVGLVVVDGAGTVRNISAGGGSGGRMLSAFRAHLGLLGIVYEVRLQTVPQYKLKVSHELLPDNTALDHVERIVEVARSTHYSSFWWFPTANKVVLSEGVAVPTTSSSEGGDCRAHFLPEFSRTLARTFKAAMAEVHRMGSRLGMWLLQNFVIYSLLRPVPFGREPPYQTENGEACHLPATGYSHRMYAQTCRRSSCVWQLGEDSLVVEESEVIIPLEELQPAIQTIRDILAEAPTEFEVNGIYFRFLSSSDGILNYNGGRESVAILWMMFGNNEERWIRAKFGLAPKQAMIQALIAKHQGRVHWGKNGLAYFTPDLLAQQYSSDRLTSFRKVMEELDPHGLFLNDFGRRLKFGDGNMSLDAERVKHCAVAENCLCQKDSDCGANVEARCSTLQGYPVCSQDVPALERNLAQMGRGFIWGVQPMFNYLLDFISPNK